MGTSLDHRLDAIAQVEGLVAHRFSFWRSERRYVRIVEAETGKPASVKVAETCSAVWVLPESTSASRSRVPSASASRMQSRIGKLVCVALVKHSPFR